MAVLWKSLNWSKISEERIRLRLRPGIRSNRNKLIVSWLCTAIPRFREVGNLAHGSLRHGISRDSILSGQRRSAPNVHERIGARTLQPVAGMGQFLNALRQHVHAAVGMFPWIDEAGGIEIADCAANLIELQQARARGDQQADSQLDGRHIFDQIPVGYERQQLAISTKRGPRRKIGRASCRERVESSVCGASS